MSDQHILSILRKSTMPIHRKLDQKGIGAKLKQGTFDAKDYKNWLEVTYCINTMLHNEKQKYSGEQFSEYMDHDLGLRLIEKDAGMQFQCKNHTFVDSEEGYRSHHVLAIAYTFLGSSLGSEFIHKYVKENIPEASTRFLEFMAEEKDKWTLFKRDLETYSYPFSSRVLSNYAQLIFERIYEIQSVNEE